MGRFVNTTGIRAGNHTNWPGIPNYFLDSNYAARELNEYILECCNNYTNKQSFFRELYLLFDRVETFIEKDVVKVKVYLYDGKGLDGEREKGEIENLFGFFGAAIKEAVYKLYGKKSIISFCMLNNEELSSNLLARYIEVKLLQGFSVGGIIGPLQKILAQCKYFRGYRISLSGRFTRKQRASKFSYSEGSVPFSTVSSSVNYSEGSIILKYGRCGIKVWTHLTKKQGIKKIKEQYESSQF